MYRFISKIAWVVLGFAIPGYKTFKLLKSGYGLVHVSEFQNLLKFWLVIATFTCISFFADTILFWFPFYYEFKIVLIFYLALPQTQGFLTIYEKIVSPKLNNYEKDIDKQAKICSDLINEQASRFYELGSNYIFELWRVALAKSSEAMSKQLTPAGTERHSREQQSRFNTGDPSACYPEKGGASAGDQTVDRSWFSSFDSLRGSVNFTNAKANLSSSPKVKTTCSDNGSSAMSNLAHNSKKYDMPTTNDSNKPYRSKGEGIETSATNRYKQSPPSSEEKGYTKGYLRSPPFQASPNSNMRSRFNQPV